MDKMNFRLAKKSDLTQLRDMYEKIIRQMNNNGIQIWNDIYPTIFFQDDIEKKRLYLLTKEKDIAAAFALCESNDGESYVTWKNPKEKAFYIDRFGVNVSYTGQGMGGLMLKKAMMLAKQKKAKYLRLFVVVINKPAINFYTKYGFKQVAGIYEEKFEDYILYEYGFEIEI